MKPVSPAWVAKVSALWGAGLMLLVWGLTGIGAVQEDNDSWADARQDWMERRDASLRACYEDPACDLERERWRWEHLESPPGGMLGRFGVAIVWALVSGCGLWMAGISFRSVANAFLRRSV